MPRPRNVNDKFRTLDTRQVRSVRDLEGLPKAEDMAAIEEERRKRELAAEKREQRKRFSRGHIRNVVKHLPYIRKCREQCRVPRKVPKKVMETMFALSLR